MTFPLASPVLCVQSKFFSWFYTSKELKPLQNQFSWLRGTSLAVKSLNKLQDFLKLVVIKFDANAILDDGSQKDKSLASILMHLLPDYSVGMTQL